MNTESDAALGGAEYVRTEGYRRPLRKRNLDGGMINLRRNKAEVTTI